MFSKILSFLMNNRTTNKIICLNKQDLHFLLETRLASLSLLLENRGGIKMSRDLKTNLEEVKKINYIRNINLLNQACLVDTYLEENDVKRVWIKGIADLYI
ncbi:hypothetical protein FC702_28105, partial [Bacillus cereus]